MPGPWPTFKEGMKGVILYGESEMALGGPAAAGRRGRGDAGAISPPGETAARRPGSELHGQNDVGLFVRVDFIWSGLTGESSGIRRRDSA